MLMNRRAIRPRRTNDGKLYTGNKRKMAILSAGAAAIFGTGMAVGNISKNIGEAASKQYLIALAKDIEGDEYENAIPFQNNEDGIIEIPNNELIIVENDDIAGKNKNNKAFVIQGGKIIEGKVAGKYLESSDMQISSKVLDEYNGIYRVTPEVGANLRDSTAILNSNILKGVAQGEIVLGGEVTASKSNDFLWRPVIYINEKEIAKGYINAQLLERIDKTKNKEVTKLINEESRTALEKLEENQKYINMEVNTAEEGCVPLHLRESADLDSEILLDIENGRKISVKKEDLDHLVENDGHNWIKVKIGEQEGYVSYKFLREVQEPIVDNGIISDVKEKVIANIKANQINSVTGIDVSNMTPEELENLYKSGINQDILPTGLMGNIDVTDINGPINYVIIRIGGTYELSRDFQTDNTEEFYVPLVKKCEELGIPYGFYYYSAATNEEEAMQEAQKIETSLESLKKEFEAQGLGEQKYNLLPLSIDVELNDTVYDRHLGNNIEDITRAKAVLTNELKRYLNEDIVLYGAGGSITKYNDGTADECKHILDLGEYYRLTGVKNVWLPTPKEEYFGSGIGDNNKAMMNMISSETNGNMNIIMQQVVLDGNINGSNFDANIIDKDKFINLIRGKDRENTIEESGFSMVD